MLNHRKEQKGKRIYNVMVWPYINCTLAYLPTFVKKDCVQISGSKNEFVNHLRKQILKKFSLVRTLQNGLRL